MVKIFYKGVEINIDDVNLVWVNKSNTICAGNISDFENSTIADAANVSEA